MATLNLGNIRKVLRRIYFGKKPKIGALQLFRAFNLFGLTLTLLIVPFVPGDPQAENVTGSQSQNKEEIATNSIVPSEEFLSQSVEIDYQLGPVESGFKEGELDKFRSANKLLNKYLVAASSRNISVLSETCRDLVTLEQSFLPIFKRVNTSSVQPKFDKYWGLASTYLYMGNLQCPKVTNKSNVRLLEEEKIIELFSRSNLYFEKILTEATSQIVPGQKEIDKIQLEDAISDENAYVADVTARAEMYFKSSAGFTSDEIKVLSNSSPLLRAYLTAIQNSDLVSVAVACSDISKSFDGLRSLESDSLVYEESLDRVKDYIFEGIQDCEKGFKKNRLTLLAESAGKFKTAIEYIEYLVSAAKRLN